MPDAPVIDLLSSLLEAQANSIFRFLEEPHAYINRATTQLRAPLLAMAQESHRHARELATLIQSLGGHASPRRSAPDEQYLAVLSFEFMLPKLCDAKQLMIERYENALSALPAAQADVILLLKKQLAENQADARMLKASLPGEVDE